MRIIGWQRELNRYVIEAQEIYKRDGFSWGSFDCVHFAGNWVQRLTGIDHLADYRGKYATREEAFALLEQVDGSLESALRKRFGEPVHPAHCMRGDIAVRLADQACGIYFTAGARKVALFLSEGGFSMHLARDTDLAFSVE